MLQNIYLAVAVIVVLGVGIAAFVLIRRGRKADREELEPAMTADPGDAGDATTSDLEAPVTPEPESAAESMPSFRAEPEPPVPAATAPLPYAPAYGPNGNGSAAKAFLADPLGVVILDMLDGPGKLSGQELKKLEVFRPERIELATRTMELPSRLENDGDGVLRLAQIKLFAATLELRSKWALQMSRPGTLPDVPFSARDFKLKMARDIMALPASDRSEVIGFLLGGILAGEGSSPELKRAVIDTLEHLRSAALVNVLLDCLDDPDPIIQEYALAAADRLLETASRRRCGTAPRRRSSGGC